MKLSFKLGTKFIVALSILLIGFGIMAVMALGMNKYTKQRLLYVGEYLIPVVRHSEVAVFAFQEQYRLYSDLVITGEDNQVAEIEMQGERIAQALRSIMAFRELAPARRAQIAALLAEIQDFTRIAPLTYVKLATVLDEEPETPEEQAARDHLQEQGEQLATRSAAILTQLETIRDAFASDLNAELANIDVVSRDIARRLVITFAIVCVLVMTSITLIVKRSVIRPLLQIVRIAEQVSAGEQEIEWLPDSRDEIGVVNTALRTMTHNLREEISVRKKAELSLRQAEKQYRMIFENSLEGIFQTRIDGKIFNANPALAQILHYDSPEELLASVLNFTEQVFASPEKGHECNCRLNEQGKVLRFETQLQCKHGDLIWVSISARSVRDPNGNVLYYEGSLMDITERKQAEALQHAYQEQIEQEVQERTRQLSETLEHLKATQQELIQSEKMAALGQLVAGVAHEINTPLGAIRASIGNIDHALQETIRQLPVLLQRLTLLQQEEFFALIERALRDKQYLNSPREDRALKRALVKELETYQLPDPEAMADTLVDMGIYQNIAPFVPLLQSKDADFVLQTAHNLTIQQHSSKTITTAVERAAKIVFALKSYARYDQSGEKVETVITNGLDVVLTLYHNQLKHGIEVTKNYQPVPPILCYQDELNQVWTNLIQNAIQAMEGKGALDLAVSSGQLASEHGGKPKDCVIVAITDSGCGVPPEIRERIFEPFFTTKAAGEGSGLGLDICRKIIDKHQGKIELESKPGRTTFRVLLPMET